MRSLIVGRDLSPLDPAPMGEERQWLSDLQEHIRASEHVIRLGDPAGDDEHDLVVYCDPAGRWQAGRYIGEIRFKGRTLRIEPRLGMPAIEKLLASATNLVSLPASGTAKPNEAFIARLMAALWCRSFDSAARHGPPSFRRQMTFEGPYVRGQLDARGTVRLRATGSPHVASVLRSRDLDNDVTRALVCAARVLTNQIGDDRWQTRRAREIVPLMRGAVGARPGLPTENDLRRVRYTPITQPYKELAALSWRIARLEGFAAVDAEGAADGLLLDVAELWELHVLRCVRLAAAGLTVLHGTTETAKVHLLRSRDHHGRGLGRLLPDVLVSNEDGMVRAVIDAKYKRLVESAERPTGVDRGDLYQLTSYLSRYAPTGDATGALVYPVAADAQMQAVAERLGPWSSEVGHEVSFMRLALDDDVARAQLRELLLAGPRRS